MKAAQATRAEASPTMDYVFSSTSKRIVRSEIRELLKWTRKPGIISFGGGLPDAGLFPLKEITEITREVLESKGYMALQYGPTAGEPEMLEALVKHMADFGDKARVEELCVTSSSQQGLDLISLLFLDEGEPLVLELPSYLGAIQAFQRFGADMRGVPMDEEGMNTALLEKTLEKLEREGKKPRFIYAIPDFQNPSGISMSLERRKELVRIGREKGILIVEDSPYRELCFSGQVLPSLWNLAGGRGVLQLKTLSKMLFPGMRMGWLVAEPVLVDKLEMLKQSVDLCTSSFNQYLVAAYIKRGKMKETIARAIECYRLKQAAMIQALGDYMPPGISWSTPRGGMFLWVVLPQGMDSAALLAKAAQNNVVYVIGRPFHCDQSGSNTLRLNFSFPSVEQIKTGIQRLAGVIRAEMRP